MTVLGSLLGKIPLVQRNFEKFVLLIIFVSLLPVVLQAVKARKGKPSLQPGD
jgi:membrane-associated protein